jgi:hypothetical protein
MNKAVEVLNYLIPQGGWILVGEDYEGITFLECEPITKEQFTKGFAQLEAWEKKTKTDNATAKAALLNRLGITADEAALLLA